MTLPPMAKVLASVGGEEATRAGVRDGAWMEGVDLWDGANGGC